MEIFLPDLIKNVLDTLHKAGFDAYAVGGCVRDSLMGKIPHDYDITTNALPYQVEALFENTVPTGIKHGTVTVIIDRNPIEITTFRTEFGYTDSRRPDKVQFVTDVKEDLSRRDFTVNALACDENRLIDCFGGKEDLENKILRAVGNPELRFKEDALRILRLFRFSSQLGFKIENNTFNAALKLCEGLKKISAERIASELQKAVMGNNPVALIPLVNSKALKFSGINAVKNIELLKKLPPKQNMRNFAFLYLSDSDLNTVIQSLKFSNEQKHYILNMQFLFNSSPLDSKVKIKKALNMTSVESVNDYILLYSILNNVSTDYCKSKIQEILSRQEAYKISQLQIKGSDIENLGFKGRDIGNILDMLLDYVIENPEYNRKDKLINKVADYRNL